MNFVSDNHSLNNNVVNLIQTIQTIVNNLHESSANVVDFKFSTMTLNLKTNVENVMKSKLNNSKLFLKQKSRHSLTYEFDIEALISSFFKKISIKKSTNNFRDKKKHLKAQVFENNFNNFATINMFVED